MSTNDSNPLLFQGALRLKRPQMLHGLRLRSRKYAVHDIKIRQLVRSEMIGGPRAGLKKSSGTYLLRQEVSGSAAQVVFTVAVVCTVGAVSNLKLS